mgnify:CR=1 FL=1
MAELSTIARPYAHAALNLAREKNALPVWSRMLELVADVAADERMNYEAVLRILDTAKSGVAGLRIGFVAEHDPV